MRTHIITLIIYFQIQISSVVSVYGYVGSDTIPGQKERKTQDLNLGVHFAFTYGKAIFSTRTGVLEAYVGSGYPYHVVSHADPSARSSQPMFLALALEKNLSRHLLLGVQYSQTQAQTIQGSNWDGAKEQSILPVEQFDVKEKYSSSFINVMLNYIIVPINFVHSRWEVTAGAGLSYNKMKLDGKQLYERHPNTYSSYDDTSASYKATQNGFGYVLNWSADFYWSRFISNQFKLEFRHTPSLTVPEQNMTYLTTRNRVRMTDTRVLQRHSIRYSGTMVSLTLRFHI